jgi:hypothetical protein
VTRAQDLLAALVSAQAGGLLATPPDLLGESGLGIAGVTGIPRARTWDAAVSARSPELIGNMVSFVVLDDGTIILDQDQPEGSLAPLADAIEATLSPPYRAAALRSDDRTWAAVAQRTAIVELLDFDGDVIEMSVVDGVHEVRVDGERAIRPLDALAGLVEAHGDVVVQAERVDGDLFAVDVLSL